jgi:acyl carrier protein
MSERTPDALAIQTWCMNYIARILHADVERLDPEVEVERLGLDSSTAVALIMSLEDWLGIELMPELLFDHPTISGLSKHLESQVTGATA